MGFYRMSDRNSWKKKADFRFNDDGSTNIRARRSDYAQAFLLLDGQKYTLKDRDYALPIFNSKEYKIFLKCGRQVEKSTMLSTTCTSNMMVIPYFKVLYFSPTQMQTRTFSSEKVRPLHTSPITKKYFIDSTCSTQVFEKSFRNGSLMFFRHVFLTADRCRGIPADQICGDEIQDILPDNLAITEETLSHSKYKWILYAATPKSVDNTAEIQWKLSTQIEWMVPCNCTTINSPSGESKRYWNILDRENIAKDGLICSKCKKLIDPTSGMWVITNPAGHFAGYRISQLMVPWKQKKEYWFKEIFQKMEQYSPVRFDNEVLGLSRDSGHKPITTALLRSNCYPNNRYRYVNNEHFIPRPDKLCKSLDLVAGIDWGEGKENVQEGKKSCLSFTLLTIGALIDSAYFWVMYMKRYRGREADAEFVKTDIVEKLNLFKVKLAGCDWGHGFGMNSHLREKLGAHRVIEFYYSWNQKKPIVDDGEKFILNRNVAIENFIADCDHKTYLFPNFTEFEEFGKDARAIFVDFTSQKRIMIYNHNPMEPDDALHSIIYGKTAALILRAINSGNTSQFNKE